jgi:MFS family permease
VRKTPLFVVFLTVFIDLLGFGMVVPLLPRYVRAHDASSLTAGLLVASYSFAQFLFAPVWGYVSDKVGRRPILILTLCGNVLSYALLAAANSLPLLFLARSLSGFFGANISTAQAYVADVTTPQNRARGMGMIGMAFGLGFVLGPAMGGLFAHYIAPWAPGAAASCLSLVAASFAFANLPESLPPELRARAHTRRHPILELGTALSQRRLAPLLILFFFLVFGFANLETIVPLFLEDRFGFDEAQTGGVFAFIGVCIAFAQGFLLSRLVRRFGEERLLRVGPLAIAIGMQGYWLAPTFPILLLTIPIVAIGMGISNPTVATLVSRRTPPEIQGRTLGLSQSLGALARALSPGLAGWLYGRFPRAQGSIVPFVWGGAVIVVGLVIGLRALSPEVPIRPAGPGPDVQH